jgi:uncharacterized membrane protein YheB (UPF0754 family)
MSKSLLTDLLSLGTIAFSFLFEGTLHQIFLFTGLFALSGAITNQLAIHMLFEKVPFLYGSGVIEKNFQSFKKAIKEMIMKQFFTKEHLENFLISQEKRIDLAPLVEKADFSPAFDALSTTVMESKFGGAISMFGGEEALEGLREPFSNKLKSAVVGIVSSETFQKQIEHYLQHSTISEEMIESIEKIIQTRLEVLTPHMVKELIQQLIHEHLGWLVVWGGVFGGMIGALSASLI